jgi:small-conductance mechanosensitive channel
MKLTLFAQWSISFLAIICSHFVYLMSRSALLYIAGKTWGQQEGIRSRVFSLSSFAYIAGLQFALRFAPLGEMQAMMNHVLFCITVFFISNLCKNAVFLAIESRFFQNIPAPNLKHGFIPLLRNLITLFSFSAAFIVLMQHFHYDVMSLVTALGVGSLAFGLASKDTLSHMIAGFILIIDRNLRPGDYIQMDAAIGFVKEIGLRSTQISLLNGNMLIVPNSELVNTKILNLSYPSAQMRSSFFLKMQISCSLKHLTSMAEKIYTNLPGASRQPLQVLLVSFSEGYQLIEVVFWVQDTRSLKKVSSDFQSQLLQACQEAQMALLGSSL